MIPSFLDAVLGGSPRPCPVEHSSCASEAAAQVGRTEACPGKELDGQGPPGHAASILLDLIHETLCLTPSLPLPYPSLMRESMVKGLVLAKAKPGPFEPSF